MRSTCALALVALLTPLLVGCGGGTSSSAGAGASSAARTVIDLKVLCPRVEDALPNVMVPKLGVLKKLQPKLTDLRSQSDEEAQNALDLLIRGVGDAAAAYSDPSSAMPGLDASEAYDGGISAFAHRCKLAGSTALQ